MTTELLHTSATGTAAATGAMQAALDALECEVAVLTSSGQIVVVNEAWRRMAQSDVPCAAHVSPAENFLQALDAPERMSREAAAGVQAVLSRHVDRFSVEYPCQAQGRQQWFQINATACEISGTPHTVLVHRSINSVKALEEKVRAEVEKLVASTPGGTRRETEEELRSLLAHKEKFLATLLHELRNPLAPIANALELLGRAAHDAATVRRARDIIQRQLQQITRLVDDLFDLAGRDRRPLRTLPTRVDVADVLMVAVESAQPLINLRNHRLTTEAPANRYFVQADATRLAQVLTNLLINAAKFTQPGGHISVITESTATDVLIHVRDTGSGIAPENLEWVFGLFSQASPAANSQPGGLGIGLAVARELMRLQGGSISVQSEGVGRGSEFIVRLPRAGEKSASALATLD